MNAYAKVKTGAFTMKEDGAVICLCVKPGIQLDQAECQRCHRPLLERMSISFNKAMTLLMMHETLIAPRQLDGVRARYMAQHGRS